MKKILISEDDRDLARSLEVMFENENYDVRVSHDAISTFSLLRSFKPDLVIADIIMPIEDGLRLCKRIVEEPIYHPIPKMIIITVRTDEQDKIKSEFIGVDAFFNKPLDFKELLKKVKELIG
jgi:two-component system response regulator VicR